MSQSKLRVMVLLEKGDVPPDNAENVDLETVEWGLEYDVISNLKKAGHEVELLEVEEDLISIHRFVNEWRPHVAFNLLEGFNGISLFDQNVISYLELLSVPYTGCNPRGLMVSRNKSLSKKVLAYHQIPTPEFETFRVGRKIERRKELEFPLFVKSLTEEASAGIDQNSIVRTDDELVNRVKYIHEKIKTDALVESYIEGRELYVGILGNVQLEALPVWELYFGESGPQIATEKLKFDKKYRSKLKIDSGPAKDLSPQLTSKVQQIAREACKVLGVNGYARVDFRLTPEGKFYVLEVNANPHIGHYEDFARSAETAGVNYHDLLGRIMSLGMRWDPEKVSVAV